MRTRDVLLAVAAALAAVALWLLVVRSPRPAPAPRVGRAATPSPTATAVAATPTPEPLVTRHLTVIVPWSAEPTPSPTEPEPTEPPTPRPQPTATPAVQECVEVGWSSAMSPVNIAQVLVEIRARNRCGRDLGPLDVWFEVSGYRNGDLVQAARGHPFDPLPVNGEATATIALPGSAHWYDAVKVSVLPPADR